MNEKRGIRFDSRLLVGLLIVVAGVLLLLERMDIGVNITFRTYWPMLLIILGMGKVALPGYRRQIFTGLVLVMVGTLFQLSNLGIISFHLRDLWPLVIILVGFSIMRNSFWGHRPCCRNNRASRTAHDGTIHEVFDDSKTEINTDYVDASVLFGGGEYRVSSKQFKGGNVNAVFGGIELDMRDAEMEGDSIVLSASALFGGVEIRTPAHWQVVLEGFPVLGGMENKTVSPKDATKKLIIKGSAMFGGLEVKN